MGARFLARDACCGKSPAQEFHTFCLLFEAQP
jgi:hypothetical protein